MSNKATLFLVEDDVNFGAVLKAYLQMNDFVVTLVTDGSDARLQYKPGTHDLCVLDVMLPGVDGFTLAKHIRTVDPDVPFIFLTAKTMKEDIVNGFGLGADDYITKPFDSDFLLLKIQAILRRSRKGGGMEIPSQGEIQIGTIILKLDIRTLVVNGVSHKLSPREFDLLVLLNQYKNRVLCREDALKLIWGDFSYFTARSMDVYIARLRKYLADDSSLSIENIHGTGYILRVPESRQGF